MSETVTAQRATPAASPSERRSWWTLVAVCGATFMLLVDITIIQVALPSVQRDLSGSFSDLEWVISAYALPLSALILTSGSIADRLGRQRVFIAGLVVFTVFSFVCGVATSSLMLIVARAVQGIGGAAMFATSLALIGQEYRGTQRVSAIAVWGATVGGAVSLGPLLGGALTGALGWRWVFFINVPIGVLTLALALARIPNVHDPEARRLDIAGLLSFSSALFLVVFAMIRGSAVGWTSAGILGCFAAAVLLLGAFVVVELRQSRPMFDLSLFRKPSFVGVSVATFAIASGMFAMLLYLTLYLQNVLGYSPLDGGLRLLPITAFAFIIPLVSPRVTQRVAPGVVLGVALALVGGGLALMHGATVGSDWTSLLPGMIVADIGIGLANPAIAQTALGVVPPQRSGMASGISNTFRVAGVATGVAMLGAIFEQAIATSLSRSLPHAPRGFAQLVASVGMRAPAISGNRAVAGAAGQAFVSALDTFLVVGAVIALAGAVAAFALVRARDLQRPQQPQQGGVEAHAVAAGS